VTIFLELVEQFIYLFKFVYLFILIYLNGLYYYIFLIRITYSLLLLQLYNT